MKHLQAAGDSRPAKRCSTTKQEADGRQRKYLLAHFIFRFGQRGRWVPRGVFEDFCLDIC